MESDLKWRNTVKGIGVLLTCAKKSQLRTFSLCIFLAIFFVWNILLANVFDRCKSNVDQEQSMSNSNEELFNEDPISVIERSQRALDKLKILLNSVRSPGDPEWIWEPSDQYPSVPYQPTIPLGRNAPKSISNKSFVLPNVVLDEINRVCNRLHRAHPIGGKIWCQLFNHSYADTLATTVTLLDDGTTYAITGDIDLMWLRDSSAQVHQYLSLWEDSQIQRIIEGLIRRQTLFIFADPYGSAFRLTLRPNPPSDDSLEPIHVQKARNRNVAMHNYELDSLCYHIRLSYSWWKQSQRLDAFDHQWLTGISIIIQLMIVEQHHSLVSPYRYTELPNNYRGTPVAYTGMTWSGFRPSDDQTKFGYLIPSNMMATVALSQLAEMLQILFPHEAQLLNQISQLRSDILSGINSHGVVNHETYGRIYAFETDGFLQNLLIDDANIPSLLSASYIGFKTPYDPNDTLLEATRRFVLSKNNSLFFEGEQAWGIGSAHTALGFVWPMSIIMEGFTLKASSKTKSKFDSVWQRLEISHADTFAMHESFHVDNPASFTRHWFAWANSLFAELILVRLELLEDWLTHRRRN